MKASKNDVTMSIPGGWYGNDAGSFAYNLKAGHVIVDPTKALEAITWLNRRAKIERTDICHKGLLLDYTLR